ncbi:hypothetical protein [Daejeonella sp.]|uniref:hypothetical protein n=1 Tax=Daejeonella sp. TaxID=2805397 RepID=UPI0030BBA4F8
MKTEQTNLQKDSPIYWKSNRSFNFWQILVIIIALCLEPEKLTQAATNNKTDEFSIIVLPDTQNYIQNLRGVANRDMFRDQVEWVVANRKRYNIAYVTQLGDLSQSINMTKTSNAAMGDTARAISEERFRACDSIMRPLDAARIPYGIAVGNHDQFPYAGDAVGNSTELFHKWFVNQGIGKSRFADKPFFGGTREGDSYDDHYDLFKAGGRKWLVIYLEFDDDQEKNIADDEARNSWALGVLKRYPKHSGIIVTHYAANIKGNKLGKQGQMFYDKMKDQPNLALILGGHIANFKGDVNYFPLSREGMNPVRTYVSDFQSLTPDGTVEKVNGGNGYLRIMKFSVKENKVTITTMSPYLEKRSLPNQFANDPQHQFQKPIFEGAE